MSGARPDIYNERYIHAGLQIMVGDQLLLLVFVFSPINFFEFFGEFWLEYWLSKFQFCVKVKPTNYYVSVSTSAASSRDIKENLLV